MRYVLFGTNLLFLKYNPGKTLANIFIKGGNLYYVSLHIKLSTSTYSTQLVDIFAYELVSHGEMLKDEPISTVVYNFHNILTQTRACIFVLTGVKKTITRKVNQHGFLTSITELFSNANWLEREVLELHGVFFSGKKDTRNLMLPYGDGSSPMSKSSPSIGVREVFYDTTTDLLIQVPTSIQV